jgi:hypothetical protein
VQWIDPAGRTARQRIGVWGALTIDQAREAARALLGSIAKGNDPRREREQRRAEAERERAEMARTLDALLGEWEALHLVERRPSYKY